MITIQYGFDKNFKNIGEAYAFSRNNNEIISFIVGIMCISAWRRYTCEKMEYAYERLHEYENKYTGIMLAAKNCYEALIGVPASIAGMHRHFIFAKTSGRVKGIKIEACQLDTTFTSSAEIASTMNKIILQCYKKTSGWEVYLSVTMERKALYGIGLFQYLNMVDSGYLS